MEQIGLGFGCADIFCTEMCGKQMVDAYGFEARIAIGQRDQRQFLCQGLQGIQCAIE